MSKDEEIELETKEKISAYKQDVKYVDDYSVKSLELEIDTKRALAEVLETLTEKEKFVLTHRAGLDGGEIWTLLELSEILEVSPEAIRKIEIKAMDKLRCPANKRKLNHLLEEYDELNYDKGEIYRKM